MASKKITLTLCWRQQCDTFCSDPSEMGSREWEWLSLSPSSLIFSHPRPTKWEGVACLSGCLPFPVNLPLHWSHRHIQKWIFLVRLSSVRMLLKGNVRRIPEYSPGIFHRRKFYSVDKESKSYNRGNCMPSNSIGNRKTIEEKGCYLLTKWQVGLVAGFLSAGTNAN